ncbi:MAG TPA: hypothetical protein DCL21_02075 [Alphaproteobacteria bacterium]|nr:hypothetical protein [Alphaproteobacteria bacterium]
MMNSRFIKHLSLRIVLIYVCIFVFMTASIILIIDATSRKQTASFVQPIVETKINVLTEAYKTAGYEKLLHILAFRKRKTFDVILKKNDEVIYTSLTQARQIHKKHNKDSNLVFYKESNYSDYIGIARDLGEDLNLTVLLNVELLEEQRDFAHVMAKVCIGISILGLLLIGLLIQTLRQRLHFVNQSLANIVKFSSLDQRIGRAGSEDEIDELSKNINEVLDHIEALANKKQLMANNIAHDLRTPLTRVSNTVNSHFKNLSLKAQEEITQQIDNMLEIFDSILRISKIDSKQPLKLETSDINQMLEDAFEFYAPLAESKGLSAEINLAPNMSMICDKGLVCQAVANCLDNAIKYTESGSIMLKAEQNNDNLAIKIIDTGIGIPQDKIDDVLQPFFRLDEARTSSGVGLGLSLVNSIIKAHNADLTIKSNQNAGTIIQLSFALKS